MSGAGTVAGEQVQAPSEPTMLPDQVPPVEQVLHTESTQVTEKTEYALLVQLQNNTKQAPSAEQSLPVQPKLLAAQAELAEGS